MPNLTISVTDDQAVRIKAALDAHYAGTALATAPIADQARDYLMSQMRALVQSYELAEAMVQAQASLVEL